MAHRDPFSGYHPLVNLCYFALVLVFTMFLTHPVSLAVSLTTALAYAVSLHGWTSLRRNVWYLLPMTAMAALLNPAFNHRGVTILAYFPSGNPLTLESILYGLGAAIMLAAAVTWFSCYSAVMTSDKFIYLFGRIAPALSLILSMTLRFVSKFSAQLHAVRQAQRCVGRDIATGSLLQRIRNAGTILSILVTWSLENAIQTADSMKSRGYGLPGRTAFSIYRLERRDKLALGWLLLCGAYLVYGWSGGALEWYYYPQTAGVFVPSYHLAYLCLCLTPMILNRKEKHQWKRSQYKT